MLKIMGGCMPKICTLAGNVVLPAYIVKMARSRNSLTKMPLRCVACKFCIGGNLEIPRFVAKHMTS